MVSQFFEEKTEQKKFVGHTREGTVKNDGK
jgi:hypothetical protein